jgi:hypothetical protein
VKANPAGNKKCIKKPQVVEGPPVRVQRTLKKHTPHGDGIAACEQTDMAATEIFFISGGEKIPEGRPEKHSPVYPSVHELIYSEMYRIFSRNSTFKFTLGQHRTQRLDSRIA